MRLAETKYDNAVTGCCAPLDRDRWDGQRFTWNDKPFVRGHMRAVMHVPLNFGAVMRRLHAEVAAADAYAEEPLWLTDELSPWGSDVLLAVDRDVPDAVMSELSGTFLTKVFEGPYRDAPKWVEEMEDYVAAQGEQVEKIYFFHPTCPDCAKKLGKNQAVLFARVR
ncbi:MAG: hydrolase [Gemmatimonadales bacterium]